LGEKIFLAVAAELHIEANDLKCILSPKENPLLIRQESSCYTSKLPLKSAYYNLKTAPHMYRFDLSFINKGRGGVYEVEDGKLTIEKLFSVRR
jgi:hypothetical protein